jgi:hypothetical protein
MEPLLSNINVNGGHRTEYAPTEVHSYPICKALRLFAWLTELS